MVIDQADKFVLLVIIFIIYLASCNNMNSKKKVIEFKSTMDNFRVCS